jgi:hypothetical protein
VVTALAELATKSGLSTWAADGSATETGIRQLPPSLAHVSSACCIEMQNSGEALKVRVMH